MRDHREQEHDQVLRVVQARQPQQALVEYAAVEGRALQAGATLD